MKNTLWNPECFSKEFGDIENDLVNCRNHVVIIGHEMKQFWDGFECLKGRFY
jgi:lysine-specific demethylase 3